jgi:hypothetical protein
MMDKGQISRTVGKSPSVIPSGLFHQTKPRLARLNRPKADLRGPMDALRTLPQTRKARKI